MQLSGNQLLQATPSALWEMLMDPATLARIIPGVSSLEKLSENSFKSILQIKIGPVSGSFLGNVQLENLAEPKSFTLKAQQNSKIGNASADVRIQLDAVDEMRTAIAFDGDVKVSGMLASMGQRLLGGVANTLTKQFFTNLEREIGVSERQPEGS
jgi:carbon monoxide dehydrogenase subunit G